MAQQEQGREERDRVLSEYGAWRLRTDEDAPALDEVRTLETLLAAEGRAAGEPGGGAVDRRTHPGVADRGGAPHRRPAARAA
ncbi:hypothetical protein [Brachybacterium sp. GPGPB12]|uniref:hypothetical protein n=1 Tax=Brachybacterium sp. GPGPB12 TaxID=3023517 RepID=UPI00313427C5